jgi:hypothetical protein
MTSGGSFIKDNDDNKKIQGGTNNTNIGNIGDNLKFTEVLSTIANINLNVTTTAVEAKVGALPVVGRKLLVITNLGPQTIYYGDAAVTASNGQVLVKNQTVSIPCTESLSVFLRAANGTQDVRVAEYT